MDTKNPNPLMEDSTKPTEYWEGFLDALLPMQLLLSILIKCPPRTSMDAILDMKILLDDTRKSYRGDSILHL